MYQGPGLGSNFILALTTLSFPLDLRDDVRTQTPSVRCKLKFLEYNLIAVRLKLLRTVRSFAEDQISFMRIALYHSRNTLASHNYL